MVVSMHCWHTCWSEGEVVYAVQVVDVLPAWALDLQRPPITLPKVPAPAAAAQSYQGDQSHGTLPVDAAEAAAMKLLDRAAAALVSPSQPSSGLAGEEAYLELAMSCSRQLLRYLMAPPHCHAAFGGSP